MPGILKNISRMNFHFTRGPVTFGDVVYGAGGICGPRVQRDFQMVILHSGSLDLRLDREWILLAPGTAILLSPGHREHFRFSRDGESRHSWCSIKARHIAKAQQALFRKARRPLPFAGAMVALLDLALDRHREAEGRESLEARYLLDLGMAMFCDFALASREGVPRPKSGEDTVARVSQFVSRELARPLTLADLARAGGVSKQHLLKLFRERKLETPTRMLYSRRLEAARDWLAHTGLSIGEIADRCGFSNAFHFSRKFRQAHGMSPRTWRAKTWGR